MFDARLLKGTHLQVDARGGDEQLGGQGRARPFSQAQVQLQEWFQTQGLEHEAVARFWAAVTGNEDLADTGSMRAAHKAAAPVMKPSKTTGILAAAQAWMAPTKPASSAPPSEASTPMGSRSSP